MNAYIDRILDNMSTKDLMRLVGDQIEENLSGYSDEELIAEIKEYYPELLEEYESVWQFRKWHTGGCNAPWSMPY